MTKTGESNYMKKIIALSTLLVLGALGMACGDGGANNMATSANKISANAMNTAQSAMNTAQSAVNMAANSTATAANAVSSAANAMKPAPATNAAAANSNMKK